MANLPRAVFDPSTGLMSTSLNHRALSSGWTSRYIRSARTSLWLGNFSEKKWPNAGHMDSEMATTCKHWTEAWRRWCWNNLAERPPGPKPFSTASSTTGCNSLSGKVCRTRLLSGPPAQSCGVRCRARCYEQPGKLMPNAPLESARPTSTMHWRACWTPPGRHSE